MSSPAHGYRTRKRMYVLTSAEHTRLPMPTFRGPDGAHVLGHPYVSIVAQADTPLKALRRFRELLAQETQGAEQVAWGRTPWFDDKDGREGVFRVCARLYAWRRP